MQPDGREDLQILYGVSEMIEYSFFFHIHMTGSNWVLTFHQKIWYLPSSN